MKISKHFQPAQLLFIIIGVLVIAFLKLDVPFFRQGLTGTLLIAVVTCSVLLGNYITSIFSITVCSLAFVYLVSPSHFRLNETIFFQTLEFIIVSVIICVLTWHERFLKLNNSSLLASTKELKGIVNSLQIEANNKDKKSKQLDKMNKDLDKLVNQFIEDRNNWDGSWPKPK